MSDLTGTDPLSAPTTDTDRFQWLEDIESERTREWVSRQNEISAGHLDALGERAWFTAELERILALSRMGVPARQGDYYVRTSNDGMQEQDSLLLSPELPTAAAGAGAPFLSPLEFDADGLVSLSGLVPWRTNVTGTAVSPDNRWLAYGLCQAGSDWVEWQVREIATGRDAEDRVTRSKFCLPEWVGDSSGFIYCRYPETDDDGPPPGGALMLHRLGTPQDLDELVHTCPDDPQLRRAAEITGDRRWLVIDSRVGMAEANDIAVHRLARDGSRGPRLDVITGRKSLHVPVGSDGDTLYLRTDADGGTGRILAFDLAAIESGTSPQDACRDVVAPCDQILTDAVRAGDGFLAVYLVPNGHQVMQYALNGTELRRIDIGDLCSVAGITGRPGDPEAFVGVTSYLQPLRTLRLDLATGAIVDLDEPSPGPGPSATHERRFANSADGTRVPYVVVCNARAASDHPRPTLVHGYGGFGYPSLPTFVPNWLAWVNAGGALVLTTLRGGNEYGRQWHEEGMRERKQNVFDDFVAVLRALHESKTSTPKSTAIYGRSNGGLLVGAALTQHPDLFAAALPVVGVLDMLRFHTMTVGWTWVPEYGDPEDPTDRKFLLRYSPLHNVRDGCPYPPTLVLTADHDDRVLPAHSYKFAARLQEAADGSNPILIRVETAAGHGVGKPKHLVVKESADILSFAAHHTGLPAGEVAGSTV